MHGGDYSSVYQQMSYYQLPQQDIAQVNISHNVDHNNYYCDLLSQVFRLAMGAYYLFLAINYLTIANESTQKNDLSCRFTNYLCVTNYYRASRLIILPNNLIIMLYNFNCLAIIHKP